MERRARDKRKPELPKASTRDILGDRQESSNDVPSKWKRHYKHLLDLRSHLSNRKGSLVESMLETKVEFSEHMGDAGTDQYDRDFALSLISAEQDALYEIDQALQRIHDGHYGICELTGKPIEKERLSAIPWTRFSKEAEEQVERQGEADRTRLGNVEKVPKNDTSGQVGESMD